jgi:hypothetical protein
VWTVEWIVQLRATIEAINEYSMILLPAGGDQNTQERQETFVRYGVEHVL